MPVLPLYGSTGVLALKLKLHQSRGHAARCITLFRKSNLLFSQNKGGTRAGSIFVANNKAGGQSAFMLYGLPALGQRSVIWLLAVIQQC